MSNFFQLFVAWGVLLLVLLSFYLIDMVNVMYRKQVGPELPKTYDDGLFGELSGKKLWDAMSGLPQAGIDPQLIVNLRPHYEPVLRQHIEQTFMQGFQDAKEGRQGIPGNNRMVATPRGKLESWLPMHHLATLYQAGADAVAENPQERLRLQQSIDQVTAMLYARTSLTLDEPFSKHLLQMLPVAEAPAETAAQAMAAEPAESSRDAGAGMPLLPDPGLVASDPSPMTEQVQAPESTASAEGQGPVLGVHLDPVKQTVPA